MCCFLFRLCDRYIHSSMLLFSFASPFLFVLYISAHGFLIPIKTVLKRMCWVVCHLKVFSQRYSVSSLAYHALLINWWLNGDLISKQTCLLWIQKQLLLCLFGAFLCTIYSAAFVALRRTK
jgi:hypothetical protein